MAFDPKTIPGPDEDDPLTRKVIGLAIEVHRHLGPGLLESVYEECLCWELEQTSLTYHRQVHLPLIYKGTRIETGFRMDLVIEDALIIELKAIDKVLPIHIAQLLTYLKLARIPKGLILNFNTPFLKDGIVRRVL